MLVDLTSAPFNYSCQRAGVGEAKRAIIQTQPQANHQRFTEALERMMTDISRNLETTNRDRFSQRVNMFRAEVKNFMVRPASFDALLVLYRELKTCFRVFY